MKSSTTTSFAFALALGAALTLFSCSKKDTTPSSAPTAGTTTGQPSGQATDKAPAKPSVAPSIKGQAMPGGIPAVGPTKPQAAAPATAPAPAKPDPCYLISFKHKPLTSHKNSDACANHKNLLKFKVATGEKLNPKTLCVKADETPISYQIVPSGLIVGPVGSQEAKITVRYCVGKARCKEDCKIPKDEFLSAIGGDNANGAAAHWDPEDKDKDTDVAAELDGDLRRELAENNDMSVFTDWISDAAVPACGS